MTGKAVPTPGTAFPIPGEQRTTSLLPVADPLGPEGRAWIRGWRAAMDACRAEIQQARWDADRLWLLAMPESDRREYLLTRLDAAARIVADEGHIDDHLERSYRLWLATLDDIREPIEFAHTTEKREGKAA